MASILVGTVGATHEKTHTGIHVLDPGKDVAIIIHIVSSFAREREHLSISNHNISKY